MHSWLQTVRYGCGSRAEFFVQYTEFNNTLEKTLTQMGVGNELDVYSVSAKQSVAHLRPGPDWVSNWQTAN